MTPAEREAKHSAILNSDYFDLHPEDDVETAFQVLHGNGISDFFDSYPFTHEQAFAIKAILERKFDSQSAIRFIMKLRSILEGAACLLDQDDFKTYMCNDNYTSPSITITLPHCLGQLKYFLAS